MKNIEKKIINHKKQPFKINSYIPRIYGNFPNHIATKLHISTNLITHAEFDLLQGTHFEPSDIHSGDEVYYILSGEVIVHQPRSGQVIEAKAGSVVHIPRECPHVGYNFGNEKAKVLTFFSPSMWSVEEKDLQIKDELPGKTINPGFGQWEGLIPDHNEKYLKSKKNQYFPVDPNIVRKNGIITVIKPENSKLFIHGKKEKLLVRLFLRNDIITFGSTIFHSNSKSDMEKHNGDEIIHVLGGKISIELNPEDKKGLSRIRHESGADEKFFIPKNTSHVIYNFENNNATIIFAVAPEYFI